MRIWVALACVAIGGGAVRDWQVRLLSDEPVIVPMTAGSVRESSVIQVDGVWYLYADVVPWDSPAHPNTYHTGIHLFSSTDGAVWESRGPVVMPTDNTWDSGGTATPGAVWFRGQVWLFYSGRERPDGKGYRHLGLATADNPAGPFTKLPEPILTESGHKDDPCPVVGPHGDEVRLYYRRATGPYAIELATASEPAGPWQSHGSVRRSEGDLRALESTDAKVIDGITLLAVMEQYHSAGRGIRTVLYRSQDGRSFRACQPDCFEDAVTIRHGQGMGSHLTLHQNEAGQVVRLGVTRRLDAAGHYSRCLYPATFKLESAGE